MKTAVDLGHLDLGKGSELQTTTVNLPGSHRLDFGKARQLWVMETVCLTQIQFRNSDLEKGWEEEEEEEVVVVVVVVEVAVAVAGAGVGAHLMLAVSYINYSN
jgi:hypothetical protein